MDVARSVCDGAGKALTHPSLPEPVRWTAAKGRSAPPFLTGMANLYARYGQLAQAVEWQERCAAWCRERAREPSLDPSERPRVLGEEAGCYESIAFYHLLLRNDVDAWTKWRDRGAEIRAALR
jgi:hypothetical protein